MFGKSSLRRVISVGLIISIFLGGVFANSKLSIAADTTKIYISTKEELYNVRYNLSGTYYLKKNITFSEADFQEGGKFYNNGKGWLPIGTSSSPFTGKFYGNGYTIRNLKINSDVSVGYNVGFFGANSGTISDLAVVACEIKTNLTSTGGKLYVGAIAGYNKGTIQNCIVEGVVDSKMSSSSGLAHNFGGGVVGFNEGTVYNCSSEGTVNLTAKSTRTTFYNRNEHDYIVFICAGGVVGYNKRTVNKCTNYCSEIKRSYSLSYSSNWALSDIGGVVGRSYGSSATVSNCINEASFATNRDFGGIVGANIYGAKVSNCENKADLSSDYEIAAIVYYNRGENDETLSSGSETTTKVSGCKNSGDIISKTNASGGVRNNYYKGYVDNCYNEGDILSLEGNAAGVIYDHSDYSTVEGCYNLGKIKASESGQAGGVVRGMSYDATVEYCYNTGDVSGGYCGGVVWYMCVEDVLNCYNTGDIYGKEVAGGILGHCDGLANRGVLKYCYNIGKVSGKKADSIAAEVGAVGSIANFFLNTVDNYSAYGNALSLEGMRNSGNYYESSVVWDFDTIWDIKEGTNDGLPFLRKASTEIEKEFTYFWIDFSKTNNELEYPIYNKKNFAKQLEYWIVYKGYLNSLQPYLEEYTYEELLDMTIDIPVYGDDGTAFSVEGKTKVKDLMAYIVFADVVQKYMEKAIEEVEQDIIDGKTDVYENFLEKVRNFNFQYNSFQQRLTGSDTFNQTLTSLLLAQTAISVINAWKITYTTGEIQYMTFHSDGENIQDFYEFNKEKITSVTSFKSYAYFTDMYKATVSESPKYYDDFSYFILSGGDKTYLNSYYQKTLTGCGLALKDIKKLVEISSSDYSVGEDVDSLVDLGLENLLFFAEHYNSSQVNSIKKIQSYKEAWDYGKTGIELVKAMATNSLMGTIGGAWELSQAYIDEVKKVYEKQESTDAGWYALAYYYLEKNNKRLLNALMDPETGSASFDFDRLATYGFPVNRKDSIEELIEKYYNNNAYLEYAYTPDEEFRLFLWNTCNTINRIEEINCWDYTNMMIEYIVSQINYEHKNVGVLVNVNATRNDSSLGTVSGTGSYTVGKTARVTATPAEGSSFVGWKNMTTGELVSTSKEYDFVVEKAVTLQAQFSGGEVGKVLIPSIIQNSRSAEYYTGEATKPFDISIVDVEGESYNVEWYRSKSDTTQGGVFVGSGIDFCPLSDKEGVYYYYAIINNISENNYVHDIKTKTYKVVIQAPQLKGLKITTQPTKIEYFVGENFETTGMNVAICYSDGSTEKISDYKLGFDFSVEGERPVLISYKHFETSVLCDVAYVRSGQFSQNQFWELDSRNGQFTISGNGILPSMVENISSKYRAYVKKLVVESGITSIPRFAFMGCNQLKIAKLENITSIGDYAFYGCSSLENIILSDELSTVGRNVFTGTKWYNSQQSGVIYLNDMAYEYKGTNDSKVRLKYGTKSIADYAFRNCTNIEQLLIPETVNNISAYGLYNCDSSTIYCNLNSYASDYASTNNISYKIFGDLSCDKQLKEDDFALMQDALLDVQEYEQEVADVNYDDFFDVKDIVRFKAKYLYN